MSITGSSNAMKNQQQKSKNIPLLILLICLIPVVGSTLLYLFWKPSDFVNNGELIGPNPVGELRVGIFNNSPFTFSVVDGRWAFVSMASVSCEEDCQKRLYLMRQIRLTQGAESERIDRILFSLDGLELSPELVSQHAGTYFVESTEEELNQIFGEYTDRDRFIYLIDPVGNLMMKFPDGMNPSLIKKDVSKLLKISKGWKRIDEPE
jgi:cytochrome oxidase Cu insertion factor (SCO1/SenC/PrrC family)